MNILLLNTNANLVIFFGIKQWFFQKKWGALTRKTVTI